MKKKKKVLSALKCIIVWFIIPTVLFMAWDVLVLDKVFDQYTATHAASCTAGILVGIGIANIPRLFRKLWRRIRKYWGEFLHVMAIFVHAIMLDDSE